MDNIALILLAVLVIGLAIWWLVGRSAPPATPIERSAKQPAVAAPPVVIDTPVTIPPPPVAVGPAATPVDIPPPAPAVAAGPPDDLLQMKGVGPKLAVQLAGLGVTRFDQIAAWGDVDLARIDAQLGAFKGRPTRDRWIEQARFLAAGDRAGYEAEFGKLGG